MTTVAPRPPAGYWVDSGDVGAFLPPGGYTRRHGECDSGHILFADCGGFRSITVRWNRRSVWRPTLGRCRRDRWRHPWANHCPVARPWRYADISPVRLTRQPG